MELIFLNQFSCSRPRVTGLLNICNRLLYPVKPQTVFKIIWRQIVQFAMRTHEIVEVHTIEIQSGDEAPPFILRLYNFYESRGEFFEIMK